MYREIRVRPVVRYIITEYHHDENSAGSQGVSAEFSNVHDANKIAEMLAEPGVVFEPARGLKIDWQRGPGEPRDAIKWVLSEESIRSNLSETPVRTPSICEGKPL
jgi:hypothetical protein